MAPGCGWGWLGRQKDEPNDDFINGKPVNKPVPPKPIYPPPTTAVEVPIPEEEEFLVERTV